MILWLHFVYNKVLPFKSLLARISSRNGIQLWSVICHPLISIKIKIDTFILSSLVGA